MYIQGTPEFEHHVKTYGPHKDFGYKDFIPMFRAEKFQPEEWIRLFKKAGARYVVPVAEHHDGFQMYKSEISHWNAFEMGPKRDVLGELSEEAQRQGLYPCASTHRIEHWFFMSHGKEFESDIKEPLKRGDFYWPSMPEQEREILEAIGAWLEINGEAIYGSKVWRKYGEGPTKIVEGQFADSIKKNFTSEDVRYTVNGSNLYAIAMRSAADGIYHFPAVGERDASHAPEFHGIIEKIEVLGFPESTLKWERNEKALEIRTTGIESESPVVFRIRLK